MSVELSTEHRALGEVIRGRRSIRKLTREPEIGRERIARAVSLALHAPSSFNMQSGRLVVLTGKSHQKLWDIVLETLRAEAPPENLGSTEQRLQGFASGAGTILVFEDQAVVRGWQGKVPLYRNHFPDWSLQASGMLQYALWLALSADGIGASLQHYNPLIDDAVKRTWGLPEEWRLIAQMPFGIPAEAPEAPQHLPVDDVVRWA